MNDEIMELEDLATSVSLADFLGKDIGYVARMNSSDFVDAHNKYAESIKKRTKNPGCLGTDF